MLCSYGGGGWRKKLCLVPGRQILSLRICASVSLFATFPCPFLLCLPVLTMRHLALSCLAALHDYSWFLCSPLHLPAFFFLSLFFCPRPVYLYPQNVDAGLQAVAHPWAILPEILHHQEERVPGTNVLLGSQASSPLSVAGRSFARNCTALSVLPIP